MWGVRRAEGQPSPRTWSGEELVLVCVAVLLAICGIVKGWEKLNEVEGVAGDRMVITVPFLVDHAVHDTGRRADGTAWRRLLASAVPASLPGPDQLHAPPFSKESTAHVLRGGPVTALRLNDGPVISQLNDALAPDGTFPDHVDWPAWVLSATTPCDVPVWARDTGRPVGMDCTQSRLKRLRSMMENGNGPVVEGIQVTHGKGNGGGVFQRDRRRAVVLSVDVTLHRDVTVSVIDVSLESDTLAFCALFNEKTRAALAFVTVSGSLCEHGRQTSSSPSGKLLIQGDVDAVRRVLQHVAVSEKGDVACGMTWHGVVISVRASSMGRGDLFAAALPVAWSCERVDVGEPARGDNGPTSTAPSDPRVESRSGTDVFVHVPASEDHVRRRGLLRAYSSHGKGLRHANVKVLVCAISRNGAHASRTHIRMVRRLAQVHPEWDITFALYENDSNDGSSSWFVGPFVKRALHAASRVVVGSEWLLSTHFASVVSGERVMRLAVARNKCMSLGSGHPGVASDGAPTGTAAKFDRVMWVESDMDFDAYQVGLAMNTLGPSMEGSSVSAGGRQVVTGHYGDLVERCSPAHNEAAGEVNVNCVCDALPMDTCMTCMSTHVDGTLYDTWGTRFDRFDYFVDSIPYESIGIHGLEVYASYNGVMGCLASAVNATGFTHENPRLGLGYDCEASVISDRMQHLVADFSIRMWPIATRTPDL